MTLNRFTVLTVSIAVLVGSEVRGVTIHEVSAGETVKLPCLSNDRDHRFQYWQIRNDEIIGPWNNYNHRMKYEVTTGELTIKGVSTKESGIYKCISRELTGPKLLVETVELVVKRDWEEEFEDDSAVNTYRALIAFFCFLIMLLLGTLAFIIARRRRSRGNLEEYDDSPDEIFPRSQGTYKPTTMSYSPGLGRKKRGGSSEALTADVVETDMKASFSLPDFG